MKKKLLVGLATGLLVGGMACVAQASTIGHAIIDRNYVDTWANFSMIDFSLQLTDTGQINSWSIFAERTGDIYLQTYRHVSGSTYEVVGQNHLSATRGVNVYTIAEGDRINFQANDYIGWTFTSPAILSFDQNTTDHVEWSPANGTYALGVGSTMNFTYPGQPHFRTYSIAAETAPVPEPATMLLLGTGLTGMIAARRKKTG